MLKVPSHLFFGPSAFLSRLRYRRRRRHRRRSATDMPASGAPSSASGAGAVRFVAILIAAANIGVMVLGLCLLNGGRCERERGVFLALSVAPMLACAKVLAMAATARAQHATAAAIAGAEDRNSAEGGTVNVAARLEIRTRYRCWLWWTRFGMAITVLQFFVAAHLMYVSLHNFTHLEGEVACFLGQEIANQGWKFLVVVLFLVLSWLVVIIQCFAGSDILRWRSFYSTHDTAWKAHYREVFDHQLREVLCCLGRAKYLTVLDEDEVYSVARLLGDLVAYRASGTGHLELIAGLALLEKQGQLTTSESELLEAPLELLQEAVLLHPYAEAAYTGPLLDFGRNPILFPCVWIHRQGVLTAWSRNRRPALQGDNWWRGHAAAFLRFVNAPPEILLRGRVNQTKREAAYFVVVLHEQRSIVIAVRGTETPEDLLTDGLCRECMLTREDLSGLIEHLPISIKERIESAFPHYGHGGIVESARELLAQLDGNSEDKSANNSYGFLSSLLSLGCELEGYKIRIVGHSLGGSVATLLGMMLYGRYPDLHVYAFGALPCLDLVLAEACSNFVTTIVLHDEFSSRLSVGSILRLRSAAMTAVSDDSSADTAIVQKLARRILQVNKHHEKESDNGVFAPTLMATNLVEEGASSPRKGLKLHFPRDKVVRNQGKYKEVSLSDSFDSPGIGNDYSKHDEHNRMTNAQKFDSYTLTDSEYHGCSTDDIEHEPASSHDVLVEPPEMFLAGLIIHIVQQRRNMFPLWPLSKCWSMQDKDCLYRGFLAKREQFRDIIVSPYMFFDHLPWRCQYAMQKVLEAQALRQGHSNTGLSGEHLV